MPRKGNSEHTLQVNCVRWFRYMYPQFSHLLFAVPNGGARSKSQGGMLKAEGVVAGVSDLILMLPSQGAHALCIEMKTESKISHQSDKQKDWQTLVQQYGYKYVVCRNFVEFEFMVGGYTDDYIKGL